MDIQAEPKPAEKAILKGVRLRWVYLVSGFNIKRKDLICGKGEISKKREREKER